MSPFLWGLTTYKYLLLYHNTVMALFLFQVQPLLNMILLAKPLHYMNMITSAMTLLNQQVMNYMTLRPMNQLPYSPP